MPALFPARRAPALLSLVLVWIATPAACPAPLAAQDFVPPTAEQARAALGPLDGETSTIRRLLTPDEDFPLIEAPEPGDWLAAHDEPGQPFANFLLSDMQAADEKRRVIYLQPLGEFNSDSAPSLEALRDYAAAFFQLEVLLLPAELHESAAFEPRLNSSTRRPQLRSSAILAWLGARLPEDAFCLVAITMTDLYPAPGWNFVFGQASPAHRAGVFSFSRHDPLFFGEDRPDDFDAQLLRRSAKTLVHEIAHIFGLWHCIHFQCVMNGVNHEAEGDSRPHHPCPICLRKLRHATGADLETRYRDLAYFYGQHGGWETEEAWVRRQLAKLRRPEPKPSIGPPPSRPFLTPAPDTPPEPSPAPEPPASPLGPGEFRGPTGPGLLPPPAPAPAPEPAAPAPPSAAPELPTPLSASEPLLAIAR